MHSSRAKLHEKIQNLNDSLIDCCLFYVLNGLTHENPKIRYHSLQMLLKYSIMNVNFVYNFAPKIEKLAKKEKDRENCLLIIKIVCQTFKAAYLKKTTPKEQRKNTQLEKEKKNYEDKIELKNPLQNNMKLESFNSTNYPRTINKSVSMNNSVYNFPMGNKTIAINNRETKRKNQGIENTK